MPQASPIQSRDTQAKAHALASSYDEVMAEFHRAQTGGVDANSARDLNVSDILGAIRDEGPATTGMPGNKVRPQAKAEPQPEPVEPAPVLAPAAKPQHLFQWALMIAASLYIAVLSVAGLWFKDRVDQLQQQNQWLQARINDWEQRPAETPSPDTSINESQLWLVQQQWLAQQEQANAQADYWATRYWAQAYGSQQQQDSEWEALYERLIALESQASAKASSKKKAVAATSKSGGWTLFLASAGDEREINALANRLNAEGVAAQTEKITRNGQELTRLLVRGYDSRQQANQYRDQYASQYGFKDAWVSKQ